MTRLIICSRKGVNFAVGASLLAHHPRFDALVVKVMSAVELADLVALGKVTNADGARDLLIDVLVSLVNFN